ncbi:MAG: hypothetical protein II875_13540 [Clostridia bacterium]|nr:hypothetical protein [Clostridia bacterium]
MKISRLFVCLLCLILTLALSAACFAEAAVLERSCSTYFGYRVMPDTDDTECCIDHLFVNGKVDVKLYVAERIRDHVFRDAQRGRPSMCLFTQVQEGQEVARAVFGAQVIAFKRHVLRNGDRI